MLLSTLTFSFRDTNVQSVVSSRQFRLRPIAPAVLSLGSTTMTYKKIHVLVSIKGLTGYEPIALPLAFLRKRGNRRVIYVTKKIHVLVSIEGLTGYEPVALPLS